METSTLRPRDLAVKAEISISYASEILAGKRAPSRPLAIHILRRTGWRHASIANLTEEQMAMLEQIEPWSPPAPVETPEPAEQEAA